MPVPGGIIVTETDTKRERKRALLDHIEHEHARERELCEQMERIADDLPGSVNHLLATPVIDMLRSGLKRHIVLYERFLLPLLVERAEKDDNAQVLSAQAVGEHAADECLAHDIADQLERAIACGHVENAGMLGYMLYCYFESRRRHLMWEEIVILPLAKRRLGDRDWRAFSSSEFEKLLHESAVDLGGIRVPHASSGIVGGFNGKDKL